MSEIPKKTFGKGPGETETYPPPERRGELFPHHLFEYRPDKFAYVRDGDKKKPPKK